MTFHVGQRVVCIKGAERNCIGGWAPRTGGVYTVRGFYEGACWDQIYLQEYLAPIRHPDGNEVGWMASRFRPLDERRLDVFRAMLAPAPKQGVPA